MRKVRDGLWHYGSSSDLLLNEFLNARKAHKFQVSGGESEDFMRRLGWACACWRVRTGNGASSEGVLPQRHVLPAPLFQVKETFRRSEN